MILPDVNVLIYTFRQDMPQHSVCRAWLSRIVEDDGPFGLSPMVLAAFVRVVTNPRTFKIASGIEEAFGFCGDLLSHPRCRIVEPGERHWDIFQRLCLDTATRGAMVSGA
jgi:uncharacterized protein